MFGLSFNPFASKTIWGAVISVVSYLGTQPHIGWQQVGGALGVLLTSIGVRDAVGTAK